MATPKEVRQIRYYVERSVGSDVVIEIPSNWRITFGFVNPAKSRDSYGRGDGHCIRLYEGEKLRAAINNVMGFRDLSIPYAKKHEKEVGQSSWESDSEGNFEESTKRQIESGFVIEEVEEPFEDDE